MFVQEGEIAVLHSKPPAPSKRPAGRPSSLRGFLRTEDTPYFSLFEGVSIGICWVSSKGRVLQCNRTMMAITGYSEPEISNLHVKRLFPSADYYEPLQRIMHQRSAEQDFEGRILRKDGTFLEARLTAPSFTLAGREVFLLSVIDITSQLQLEARLQQVEQTLAEKELELERKAVALSEVMEQVQIAKTQLKERISANIQEVVLPTIKKLRMTRAPPDYLDLVENHLREISSSFGLCIAKITPNLSPREVQISSMVQRRFTSKQIAYLLGISRETVEKHRKNIRKKVGISGTRSNLTSFLQGDLREQPGRPGRTEG